MPGASATAKSITPTPCGPRARCRQWRTCPACGRIRQAHLADIAERLQALYPSLTWSVLRPHNPGLAGIAHTRDRWRAQLNPPAAIWTIERSAHSTGLHLNIIHPTTDATPTLAAWVWSQAIVGSVRHVAAYVIDPRKAPRPDQAPGRHYGTLGPLWYILAAAHRYPLVQAVAIQHFLDPAAAKIAAATAAARLPNTAPATAADFRAIAARYLPALLDSVGSAKGKSRPE